MVKKWRYLIARRCCQLGILALFALPGASWILRGDLSASRALGSLPLAEPLAVLELLAAGGAVGASALLGAAIIAGVYALFGRAFCGWVCPVNLCTNAAEAARRALGLGSGAAVSRRARYALLAGVLLAAAVLQTPIWQGFSHYGALARGIIFAQSSALGVVILIFIIDLRAKNFTCALCPLGAFYALLGRFAPLRMRYELDACSRCGECVKICPEPQVLALIGRRSGAVSSGECIRCGRCAEVCSDGAIEFNLINLLRRKNEEISSN